MWEPRRLTTLWASMACYRESFTISNSHKMRPKSTSIISNVQDGYRLNVVDYGASKLNLTSFWFQSVQYSFGSCLEHCQLSYKRLSLGLIMRKFADDVKPKMYNLHFQHACTYLILKKLKETQFYRKHKETENILYNTIMHMCSIHLRLVMCIINVWNL
jgi:hypothetical protein